MFAVMVGVAAACGMLLAGAHDLTRERITAQHIRYVKGPAIRTVLAGVENDPLLDRRNVASSGGETTIFLGKTGGKLTGVALETVGKGYGGPVGVITAFDPVSGNCKAIAVSFAAETPGIGSRVADTAFTRLFTGLELSKPAALRVKGGSIDGISGATVSSRAVCDAVADAQKRFTSIRPALGGAVQ